MSDQLSEQRTSLLNLIATLSFRIGDFTLASGQRSDYYIDCRTTTLHAEGGRLAGLLFYDLIRQHLPHAEAVGGLTMGADPLVSNTASASAWNHLENKHHPLVHGFLVRKAEKAHGTGRLLEGYHKIGAHTVIVDDAFTTGGSAIRAIEATKASGMNVIGVLSLVDREQGARENIAAIAPHVPFYTVFTAKDVRAAHLALHPGQSK
jgi:orotate phosphoribosyltransferase